MLLGLDKQDRLNFRIAVELPVRYLYIPDGALPRQGEEFLLGTAENLSRGGMLLRTDEPPLGLVGDLLSGRMGMALTIDLGDGEPAKALARVAWVEGMGQGEQIRIGVKFHEITTETKDRITEYVVSQYLP